MSTEMCEHGTIIRQGDIDDPGACGARMDAGENGRSFEMSSRTVFWIACFLLGFGLGGMCQAVLH